MISFRKSGPSGRGEGRIRFYVDLDDRCIGSVEGRTGDYTLDGYGEQTATERVATPRHRTRLEAAEALAALVQQMDKPPIGKAEYSVLVQCKERGLPSTTPSLSMARMLAARGLLKEGRTTADYRTTAAGKKAIDQYDRWHADRSKPTATTTSNEGG